MEGGVRVAADDTRLAGAGAAAAAGAVFQIVQIHCFVQYLVTQVTLWCNFLLFTFSYPSHLKHLVLRACLEDRLPEMLSKVGAFAERSMNKSKKHRAVALAALGGCGGLGQLWEALAELWEALGELLEGLYIEKLPCGGGRRPPPLWL